MRSSPVRGSVPAFADGRATARVCIRPAIVRVLGKPPGLRSGLWFLRALESGLAPGSRPVCGADPIRGRGHPLRVQPLSLCESGLHGRALMVGLRRRQRPRRPVPAACLPGPAACHAELSDCLSPVQCRPNPTCRPGSPPTDRPNSSDCPNLLGYSDPPSRQGLPSRPGLTNRSGLTNRQGPSGRQGLPSRPEAGPRSPAGRRSGRSGR